MHRKTLTALIVCLLLAHSMHVHSTPVQFDPAGQVDMVIFSYNRPMQLYALLKSTARYIQGLASLQVIFRADGQAYEQGYAIVRQSFNNVSFTQQGPNPHQDFKPLALKASFNTSKAPYILYAVDDIIVTNYINLNTCIDAITRYNAYGFYLRLGQNITHCYMEHMASTPPPGSLSSDGFYVWQFRNGRGDWGYPNTVDLTVYRKSDIQATVNSLSFVHPNSFEGHWSSKAPARPVGVSFPHSCMVNLPLNLVNISGNQHMNWQSAAALLTKFLEGYEINIDTLYQIDNISPHMNYEPQLIKRIES